MSLRLQLKHATHAFRFANRCQTRFYVQVRSFSDSKQIAEELKAEVNKYKEQAGQAKTEHAKLISRIKSYTHRIKKLKDKNVKIGSQSNDTSVQNNTASHASTSEPVSSENEDSALAEQISHLLSVLAQDQKLRTKNANKKDPTSVELQSMQTSIKEVRRNVETLSNQVKKLQRSRQNIKELSDQIKGLGQRKQKVDELIFQVEKLQRQFDRSNGAKADSGKRSELVGNKKASATEQKTTWSDQNVELSQAVDDIFGLAVELNDKQQYAKAIDLLHKAIELEETGHKDPKNLSQLWFKLARSYHGSGNLNEALKAANKAVDFNLFRRSRFLLRARIYQALGRKSEAIEDLQRVINLSPNHAYAKDWLNRLTS